MARVLIVGCGCRGQQFARELRAGGHAVRGTTRYPAHRSDIEAAGAESFLADPDRVGTLIPALAGVSVMCLLLASATGAPDRLEALHTTRLEMLLQRTIDTTIRGVLYEAKGTNDEALLATGAGLVETKCRESRIRFAVLRAEPSDWLAGALSATDALLAPD
jgi:uncharacterized protein YbjT (DUF2867 family)